MGSDSYSKSENIQDKYAEPINYHMTVVMGHQCESSAGIAKD